MNSNISNKQPDLSMLQIRPEAKVKTESRRGLWIGLAIAAVLAAVVFFYLFSGRPALVEIAAVRVESTSGAYTVLNASGYVTPRRRTTVAAKITGQITALLAEEGMIVKKGQVLARLDDADARARLAQFQRQRDVSAATIRESEVGLANAEKTLERMHKLLGSGGISRESYDQAAAQVDTFKARIELSRAEVASAEAAVRVSQQDLENCVIRAPFDGVVVTKDAQVGEMVSPMSSGGFTRTGIATIVDMQSLEIEVDVNEAYIAKITINQKVTAVLDAYPDWKIPAKVRTVIPTADRQKATVKVRIGFDKLDPKILPDMGVKVSFLEEEAKPSAVPVTRLLAPKEAVRMDQGVSVVYLYKDGRLERRAVKTGVLRGTDQEILSGLQVGEQVVTRSERALADGMKVRIRK
ncbi:MAG: efflux RND transporter periplasmic adaptor subunit [Desulfobacteraceae bacterium]|nr:MAG: efflux RND transporter periplasmic adaptor subunit [Desulfobacteraceae bacterium]